MIDDLFTAAIEWTRALPFDCYLNKGVYSWQGSPTDGMIYLLEDVNSGQPNLCSDTDSVGYPAYEDDLPVVRCS